MSYNLLRSKTLLPTESYSGPGSLIILGDRIINDGNKRLFIVSSKTVSRTGMLSSFTRKLESKGIVCTVFTRTKPDPDIECIESGLAMYNGNRCDSVLGVGGGSVIDCAKVIAMRAGNPNKSIRKISNYLTSIKKPVNLYAAPTTAGTGSEITMFSVVKDSSVQKKFSIVRSSSVPLAIALDPDLCVSLPPDVTASSGMDALTHAIEAYISTFSDKFYRETQRAPGACRMIFENLYASYIMPENKKIRLNMLKASYYAGISFRHTATGYIHSMSHRLTELYGIPHGYANAVLLPHFLEAYMPEVQRDLSVLSFHCGFTENKLYEKQNADIFIREIRKLNKQLKIQSKIPQLKRKDFEIIIKRTQAEAKVQGCPKILTDQELREILISIS